MTKTTSQTFKTKHSVGSSKGFSASAFASHDKSSVEAESRKLVVGRDISLSGEIAACDHLIVEGTVEATIKGGQSLEVTETGLFKGTVEIDDAVIAGKFEGNLVVKGYLVIKSTGHVSGNIQYGDMAVESGAKINGKIKCVGLPKAVQDELDKKVGSVKPVFKSSVANEDVMLHEETTIQTPIIATI